MRIVSLLPSATEIVAAIGLADHLVGVTHECDYPAEVRSLPKLTRTLVPPAATSREIDTLVRERVQGEQALYRLDTELLARLEPDLIITQSLCEVCAVAPSAIERAIAALPVRPQVLNLEPTRLAEVLHAIEQVGATANRSEQARLASDSLRQRMEAVARRAATLPRRPRGMLLEWIDPPFCGGHWNPELMQLAGAREVIGQAGKPSRQVAWEELLAADPEVLLIAGCGFDTQRSLVDLPALQSRPEWNRLSCVRSGRVYVTDGSAYFNRPGPRLVDSLEILAHAIDAQAHPLPPGLEAAIRV